MTTCDNNVIIFIIITLSFEMYKAGKENRMSRVSLPDYEGGSLE